MNEDLACSSLQVAPVAPCAATGQRLRGARQRPRIVEPERVAVVAASDPLQFPAVLAQRLDDVPSREPDRHQAASPTVTVIPLVSSSGTVTALRIAWPASEQAWPAWALPAFPQPTVVRRADGTAVPALAACDLTAAVLAALDRDGGFDIFHILGGSGPGFCLSTAKARALLGWQPRRR